MCTNLALARGRADSYLAAESHMTILAWFGMATHSEITLTFTSLDACLHIILCAVLIRIMSSHNTCHVPGP